MRRNRLTARLVTALVAATPAVALAVVAAAPPQPSGPAGVAGRAGPLVQTFPFGATGALRPVAATSSAELPARATEPFSMLGVTWANPRARARGTIEVRTRAAGTGRWSPWRALETDNPDASGGAEGARGASDPLWVGPSDGVQARIADPAGRPLPDDLRIDLINPDGEQVRTAPARPRMAPVSAHYPTRPVPRMVTRAGWGANEALVKDAPEYTGPIQVVFVHHTATGNDYSCSQSSAIVRGIQVYQVRSKGWDDIGYNFLVDKCGTIFEGRGGGVHRSVLGAHTLGFNTDASAVVAIGDYRGTAISSAARASVAQVAAYKLGAWGSPPQGRVVKVSGGSDRYPAGRPALLNRISGHRDTGATECPGNALYAQLPAIRAIAGAAPSGLRIRRLNNTIAYAGRHYTRGLVRPLWDLSTPTRMIDHFEVWVDGRLLTLAPNGHRLSRMKLPRGRHAVVVKAVHLSGRTSATGATVIADPVPPRFTAVPQLSLRTGTMADAVPVRLTWTATDPSGLRAARVGGASQAALAGAARALNTTARLGETGTWAVTVTDRAGSRRSSSVTRTPMLLAESAARRTGTWRTLRDNGFLGSEAATASTADATMSWTFTGRAAALVVGRTATSGRVRISVDGRYQGVLDLRSDTAKYRQVVWSRLWRDSGTHTVTVEAEGTTGRGSVMLDGLSYLR
ncbi:N-acetylmuramoyl-L-alanine amidase [Actinoplanes sp. NBRC 101535]|uniref:N-acetylmuramoyl-L-alanine amidase n=1 Tax=Actinoplanes sp. NBRC 101535 TaxID=3032196 RepID=UPI0024A3F093|nr:N-acetylmuramoyl-L-alanine amidase [Actinoplanes sp. NBRC 101535]GLY05662.1 hypothetical protein Acsp01_60410 [Actinoplanes sp. NBRC 101535]